MGYSLFRYYNYEYVSDVWSDWNESKVLVPEWASALQGKRFKFLTTKSRPYWMTEDGKTVLSADEAGDPIRVSSKTRRKIRKCYRMNGGVYFPC